MRIHKFLKRGVGLAALFGLAGLPAACKPPPPTTTGTELVTNGGFEKPAAPPDPNPLGTAKSMPSGGAGASTNIMGSIHSGAEPPGFGWTVESGDVDVVAYGYDSGGGDVYLGPMAEGHQSLDLDGRTPGTISERIHTEPGGAYALSFAYANNPDGNVIHDAFLAEATVGDAAPNAHLIPPLNISDTGSTTSDFHWTRAGPLTFTALSNETVIRFASHDAPYSSHGISLDDVSVKTVPVSVVLSYNFTHYALPVLGVVTVAVLFYIILAMRREKAGDVP